MYAGQRCRTDEGEFRLLPDPCNNAAAQEVARSGYAGDGGLAREARLNNPVGVAVDGDGNVYIADTHNYRIRRVDPEGIITTFAGTGERGFSGDGGPAVEAQLNYPVGVAVDGEGNVYIADAYNYRIRRVDPEGIITTFAGTGERGFSGDGGPAVEARLNDPWDVTLDGDGNFYIADSYNHRVRRIDPVGTITTFAGNGQGVFVRDARDGEPAVEARLNNPVGVVVDGDGNLYIADSGYQRIRRVDPSGIITTFAGMGYGSAPAGDGGPAVEARLGQPLGVAMDGDGNLYIVDARHQRIRRVDPAGTITTFAGSGHREWDVR